jgi:hypothetical protein
LFQRKSEWAGLLEHHPDLFEKAKEYEKVDPETGERYTWSQSESLEELARPERLVQIRGKADSPDKERRSRNLLQILAEDEGDNDEEQPCAICFV